MERAFSPLVPLFPRALRERTWNDAHADLLLDYYESQVTITSTLGRAWLVACFTLRTIVLVLQCWREWGISKLLPAPLRRWWMGG